MDKVKTKRITIERTSDKQQPFRLTAIADVTTEFKHITQESEDHATKYSAQPMDTTVIVECEKEVYPTGVQDQLKEIWERLTKSVDTVE